MYLHLRSRLHTRAPNVIRVVTDSALSRAALVTRLKSGFAGCEAVVSEHELFAACARPMELHANTCVNKAPYDTVAVPHLQILLCGGAVCFGVACARQIARLRHEAL